MSTFLDFIKPNTPLQNILQAGLLAGTLDILAAFTNAYWSAGTTPVTVLKFVASGVWGRAAFAGGTSTALWGLLFHFLIALSWAVLFFLFYPAIQKIAPNWIFNGIIYGIIIWTIMNWVILPMTNAPARPFNLTQAIINIFILIICVGLPISGVVARYYINK